MTAADFWWVPIASAVIGAVSALVTPFVKDLLIHRLNERNSKTAQQREIFRNYAAPLAASCEKLIWRFSEIFVDSRHHFLKTATLPLVFNQYKRKSTLFRVASLLGWIRAINLELSALPRGASGFLAPVSDGIQDVQKALADGPHVEVHRLKQVCAVWRVPLDGVDEKRLESLATKFEVNLYNLAGDSLRQDSDYLKGLDKEKRTTICRQLAKFLCSELRRSDLSDEIVVETMNQAIAALSYREALIYRDWQDAIGDAMLEPDVESVRKFKIVGYQRFEEILLTNTLWMDAFRDSIDDIDFEAIDPNDFRAKQLYDLALAVSGIIVSMSKSDERDLISQGAINMAHRIQNTTFVLH